MSLRTTSQPRKSKKSSSALRIGAGISCATALATLAVSSQAQLINEGFNYVPGNIEGQSGMGAGLGTWDDMGTSIHKTELSSLNYTDVNGNALVTSGGKLTSDTSTTGAIARNTFTPLIPSANFYYLSFIINPFDDPNPSSKVSYGGIAIGDVTAGKYAFIGVAGGVGKYTIQAPNLAIAPNTNNSVAAVAGQSTLLVARISVLNNSAADSIDLFINPTFGTPLGTPTVSFVGIDLGSVHDLQIRNSALDGTTFAHTSGGRYDFDEIRVGTTYNSVTPFFTPTPTSDVPEPGNLAFLAGSAVTGGLFAVRRRKASRRLAARRA